LTPTVLVRLRRQPWVWLHFIPTRGTPVRVDALTLAASVAACGGSAAIDAPPRTDASVDACTQCDAMELETASYEWEVTVDIPLGEQVFPRVVVVSGDRVFVLTEPNNYVVRSDRTVMKVPGPNWYSPMAAVPSGSGVAVVFGSENGDSTGFLDGDGELAWGTPLAIIASPFVLFRGVSNPTVLWTSPGGTVLSEFDSTGTDVLARPVSLPANAVSLGYGAAGAGTLLAPAYVGLDDPCAIMRVFVPRRGSRPRRCRRRLAFVLLDAGQADAAGPQANRCRSAGRRLRVRGRLGRRRRLRRVPGRVSV
jgi:hypothetical protein